MNNKLENWIKARFSNEKEVMDTLQEYGVVSDNCVMAKNVGNDGYAIKWLARNSEFLPNENSRTSS